MNAISTNEANSIAMQKDIFRLAAAIYTENSDIVSDSEIQLQILKCMFVKLGNDYLTKNEIINEVLEMYKYYISEVEIENVIHMSQGVFQSIIKDDEKAYCLTPKAKAECEDTQKNNIDSYIDLFISEKEITDNEKCKNAIHVYLYELTTTNINSYKMIFSGKNGNQLNNSELLLDVSDLTTEEKQLVHDFLSWDNTSKNEALGNLVYCCLEYCLLINGDSPNSLLKKFIRNRDIYLDTNIIFRALGINGVSRQKVIISFLKKCKQANLKLIISSFTKKEFFDTINYYVSQIGNYPRGRIFAGAYEEISDYNIFAFYESWRNEHINLQLKYFISYIKSLYIKFINDFLIVDDVRISASIYDSKDFKDVRNKYSASINHIKKELKENYFSDDYTYSQRDSHDATLIRYIELQREKSRDKDIFLASSDRALRCWDMSRPETDYPVVIYPSQLFLVLLKTCGRSENDFDSFVSFINIRPSSNRVSPENANIIISGISSITEDIKVQEHLVSAVFSDDFQDVIRSSTSDTDLFKKVQYVSQKYLEKELKNKSEKIEALKSDALQKENESKLMQNKINYQNVDIEAKTKMIEDQKNEIEKKQKQITTLAEKNILPVYILKVYVVPVFLALCLIFYIIFIAFQFFFKDKNWNFAIAFFEWLKSSYFASEVTDYIYVIDAAIGGGLLFILKKFMKNPFNRDKKECYKMELVQKYLEKKHLD